VQWEVGGIERLLTSVCIDASKRKAEVIASRVEEVSGCLEYVVLEETMLEELERLSLTGEKRQLGTKGIGESSVQVLKWQ
jgi:hypothetical protein